MAYDIPAIKHKLESGFYGFWVKRWRTTFLVIFLMIILGLTALVKIPKESNPTISYGIITVATVYPWVNPQDIDNLITEKIESELKDVDGVKKLSSTSSIGVGTTIIELENGVDMTKALSDVKTAVAKVSLPADALDPIITEVSTDNQKMFSVLLYGKSSDNSPDLLKEKARKIKKALDGKWNINSVDIDWTSDYEIHVLVQRKKADALWVSLLQLSQVINAFNKNQPLGNHSLGDLSYDFRIDGELKDEQALLDLPVSANGGFIKLGDIATVQKKLKDQRLAYAWTYKNSGNSAVLFSINKKSGSSILATSEEAKTLLAAEMKKQEYKWLHIAYMADIADKISNDYSQLARTWVETLILVFLSILLFVGFKEALIGSVTVPLSFFITFFVLNEMGMSLNFLTNFSLIICFGIAIDATIVVIQWAHEKMRQWFSPKSAVLLSIRDYHIPLISGTLTTVIVFLPLFTLPGIMGKFLAYIPITIFVTLVASLFISLTLNSAMYFKLTKDHPTYDLEAWASETIDEETAALLEAEREWKTPQSLESLPWRERYLDKLAHWYSEKAGWIMKSPRTRIISILSPLILLILSFVFLSPFIGFKLYPTGDAEALTFTFTAKKWTTTDKMKDVIVFVDPLLAKVPEAINYYYVIDKNVATINVRLLKKDDRGRSSFEIEDALNKSFSFLLSKWIKVESKGDVKWPSSSKAVGIKLIADSNDKFTSLIQVAHDFEKYLRTVHGTKNVWISSADNPGQFVFSFLTDKLAVLWLKPTDLSTELYAITNGVGAWALKWQYDNHDIKVKYADFDDLLTPSDVQGVDIPTSIGKVQVGALTNYSFENAVSQISRENTKIIVKVESDLADDASSTTVQSQFTQFASTYKFPQGISYEAGGENQDNADLLQAMVVAFIVALFLIFVILVLQFNSYTQSVLILYSVVMWLFGANIGLFVTNNPYSLSFMIGFIALTGIVVNHVIVFIDRINVNLDKGMTMYDAVVETGKSRLHPVLLTTVSAVVWLFSIARQDKFFAGLSYTIIFGLIVATIMTLFVLPALYFDKEKIITVVRRTLLSFITWIWAPFIAIGLLVLLSIFVGYPLWNYAWFGPFIGVVMIAYTAWYQYHITTSWQKTGQTFLQHRFGSEVRDLHGHLLTRTHAIKRLIWMRWLLLSPIVIARLLSTLVWLLGGDGSSLFGALTFVWYLIYVFWSVYLLWTSDKNQLLHDRYAKTQVIYHEKPVQK